MGQLRGILSLSAAGIATVAVKVSCQRRLGFSDDLLPAGDAGRGAAVVRRVAPAARRLVRRPRRHRPDPAGRHLGEGPGRGSRARRARDRRGHRIRRGRRPRGHDADQRHLDRARAPGPRVRASRPKASPRSGPRGASRALALSSPPTIRRPPRSPPTCRSARRRWSSASAHRSRCRPVSPSAR